MVIPIFKPAYFFSKANTNHNKILYETFTIQIHLKNNWKIIYNPNRYSNQYYCTSELKIWHTLSYQTLWTSWELAHDF